ncbi:hypothetical protein HETIRDRAFT_106204 [Heterobasidion irregulare TC 32-1]|uniref:Uncharacterized protein n=1 Tax=Heterobasidion irregulare (strain TC 32-1) TaxID=747525 RepID=W4JUR6_HETIT|nr:uncharacterized protein HETIRDRAFT_106204 [Heterobasidion irregulare TC 32-1]ETW76815.1 hypothetical protein HETIRDRAFT_106204 [Heterobasidion irregulare TC 32-1]
MFRTFGVIGCALWNGALDAVKGIVVVVQGLQGYDVQLNEEERVRASSRTLFSTDVEDSIDRHKRTLKALHLPEGGIAVDEEELPPQALARCGYPETTSEVEGESSTLLSSGH